MSRETLEWLNTNTLIGFTDKRGHAWHYRQGSDNHYAGAIPVQDVETRLFDWTAVERPVLVTMDADSLPMEIPNRKAIMRSDNGHVMGIFRDGYQPHQYREWLLDNVGAILDTSGSDLQIGSAGLLKGGAVAWVSVEVPDTITTPEGVMFRPNLLACTSFDGSIATTYKRVITNVVCDNTMAAALSEHGAVHKTRHSKNSMDRLSSVRSNLDVQFSTGSAESELSDIADTFAQEVKELCEREVSPAKWDAILDAIVPMPNVPEGKSSRGATMAENKRDELTRLWNHDPMVSPWNGTAYGVYQALNTYAHHSAIVRGSTRPERNMQNAITGKTMESNATDMNKVLALV